MTEDGIEFWYARELQKVLEYTKWGNFTKVIEKAKEACDNSGYYVVTLCMLLLSCVPNTISSLEERKQVKTK